MLNRIQLIAKNEAEEASLGLIFSDEIAHQLAITLKNNTVIKRLDCSVCELNDDHLRILSEGLFSRQGHLEQLNLEFNDLTPKSVAILEKLISSKKVLILYLFNNEELTNDVSSMQQLQLKATEHGAQIVNEDTFSLYKKRVLFPRKISNSRSIFSPKSAPLELREQKEQHSDNSNNSHKPGY